MAIGSRLQPSRPPSRPPSIQSSLPPPLHTADQTAEGSLHQLAHVAKEEGPRGSGSLRLSLWSTLLVGCALLLSLLLFAGRKACKGGRVAWGAQRLRDDAHKSAHTRQEGKVEGGEEEESRKPDGELEHASEISESAVGEDTLDVDSTAASAPALGGPLLRLGGQHGVCRGGALTRGAKHKATRGIFVALEQDDQAPQPAGRAEPQVFYL